MFSENLDLIMKLTDTRASALGAACHLDPSHVSRLRTGTRPLPRKPGFLRSMSEYLAKRINTDDQKKAVCGMLNIASLPEDTGARAELIENWLTGDEPTSDNTPDISPLIRSFTAPLPEDMTEKGDYFSDLSDIRSYYYGNDGKREAVLHFFDLILREKKPRTLLLFSDEDMDWLFGDSVFTARWLHSFTEVIKAGNRVKIIHHISRRMDEMLEAVAKWIPVYRTGMIEPYYYPRPRDGVFRRTLFIAPDTAAVVSASVGSRTDDMLNELITDKDAVAALTGEFEHYFSLCRPLMHIFTPPSRGELRDLYDALIVMPGNIVCMSDMPTLFTMPEWVAEAMQKRAPGSNILQRRRILTKFAERLAADGKHVYTEILPRSFDRSAPPPLPCGELMGAAGLSYTAEEWKAHTESSVQYAGHTVGYVQVYSDNIPGDVSLLVKEERGVIMTGNSSPFAVFALSEQYLVNMFWDFLLRLRDT